MIKNEFELTSGDLRQIKEAIVLELLKLRKKSKMTQTMISESTGLPQTTISRVESFGSEPNLSTIIKYAEALGLEVSIILKPKSNESEESNQKVMKK